jgi:putative DNA primase/helicase
MTRRIELTALTKADGPLTKHISYGPDGKIVSDGSACTMSRGTARRVAFSDLGAFARFIGSLKSDQAIAAGTLRDDLPDLVDVVVKSRLESMNGAVPPNLIARTSDYVSYRAGQSALALIDTDLKGMTPSVKANVDILGGVWPAIVSALPALETAARVTRRSTSAGLSDSRTGKKFEGSGGLHIYVVVKDGSDIRRFLDVLHARMCLNSLGWGMLGRAGQFLERSLVDRTVAGGERLIFEGRPIVMRPLVQDRAARAPVVTEGCVLNTREICPDLTTAERTTLVTLLAAERERLAPEAEKLRSAFIDEQVARIVERTGGTPEDARRTVEQQCEGILLPDVVLPFDRRENDGVTVGDVLANPDRFVGATMADPIEGVRYGRGKAKLYRRRDGTIWISSRAHGGARYYLRHSAEPEAAANPRQDHEAAVDDAEPVDAIEQDEAEPEEKKPEAATDAEIDAEVERLAALSDVEYDRERKPMAKRLGITLGVLDKKVKQACEHKPASAAERDASIKRLADASRFDYNAVRKREARALGINVSDLDREVATERRRRRDKAAEQQRNGPPPGPAEVHWPAGFEMKPDGLYGPPGEDTAAPWLSAAFEVLGHIRDYASEAQGLCLRWRDGDGVLHTYSMPFELLAIEPGRLEAELMRRGLRIRATPGARALLRMALGEVAAGSRVRVAYTTGWQGTDASPVFLLPDGTTLGDATEAVVLHNPSHNAGQRCAVKGTLDEWKTEVAAKAAGNSLATFCISAALAPPLLAVTGDQGGGFHLFGDSKRGKTLALQMGLSAWGLPYKAGGALRDWKSTANALEAAAAECNDMPLTLDEVHQANPADVTGAVYMVADGGGKSRLSRNAIAAPTRGWNTIILSTGEPDIPSVVARTNRPMPAGAEVRMPSVPVPDAAKAWPALHSHADFGKLAAALHHAFHRQHGTGGRAFVSRLAAERVGNHAALTEFIDTVRTRFAKHLPADADPQVCDVARRFALVAAAGELATSWGILPWKQDQAGTAALAMFNAWVTQRPGGMGAAETAAQLDRVRSALVQYGAGRFTQLRPIDGQSEGWQEDYPDRPVQNRIGWRKRDGGRDEFLIPPETWRSEICAPAMLDPIATARTLARAGFSRRDGKNLTVNERLPGFKKPVRVYAISAALLEAEDDKTEAAGDKATNAAMKGAL